MELDERLQRDSYLLGYLQGTCLLLSRNAYFPWFILVPDTRETEFVNLNQEQQLHLLDSINRLSGFIKHCYPIDKLNIATIGNVVSQLHIHVVGRRQNDPCWPAVVWGCEAFRQYTNDEVRRIRDQLAEKFGDLFQNTDLDI